MTGKEWNPEEILAALDMESIPTQGEHKKSPEELGKKRLFDNAAFAAETVLFTMRHGETESLRFKAAQEVLNRVYGKVTDQPVGTGPGISELEKMLDGVVSRGE